MFKKGVSPLIATVLLIAFVVAIGAVVMNWGTGYIKSEQEKATSTSDVRLTCATNVNLKLMKVSNLKDYCYDNSTGSVTISARLSKGEKDLKGIRVNVISNSISETKDYSREISNLNFQINLGNFSNDLINNNGLIEYVELVPYIDNNGEDYFCSGASLELSDFSLCDYNIVNAFTSGDNNESNPSENSSIPEEPMEEPESRFEGPSFISLWDTTLTSEGSSESNQIKLPLLYTGYYNFTIDWGDGTIENITFYNQSEVTHSYSSSGEYILNISGTIKGFAFKNEGDKFKIKNITQWGGLRLGNTGGYFWGAKNLVFVDANDILNTTAITNMSSAFRGIQSSTSIKNFDIDVSNVVDMSYIFSGGYYHYLNLTNWNTSKVIYLNNAFSTENSVYVNIPFGISNWDVSSVENMYATFNGTSGNWFSSINDFIEKWNVSNVKNMSYMFSRINGKSINFSRWDVSNVVDMTGMFSVSNSAQHIFGDWNTSNLRYMKNMFSNTRSFSYNFSKWDVSNVLDMSYLFANSDFGSNYYNNIDNIDNWDVSNVEDMSYMFNYAHSYCTFYSPTSQCNISNWDVSNVKNMSNMFSNVGFDGDVSNWDVSNVEDMSHMFDYAYNFDLNIFNWNISNVKYLDVFFGQYMDSDSITSIFDRFLNHWSTLELQRDIMLGFSGSGMYYCNSESAFDKIIENYNWTIESQGLYYGCPTHLFYEGPSFVSLWDTTKISENSSLSNQIRLPLNGGGKYNFTIDWGDGNVQNITLWNQSEVTHTYLVPGEYLINISNYIQGFAFNGEGDRLKLMNVIQWGGLKLGNTGGYFWGAENLNINGASDILSTRGLTNMNNAFRNINYNGNVSMFNFNIDVSKVVEMQEMFKDSNVEKLNLSNWNTENVVYFSSAFENSSIPLGIEKWNTSECYDMNNMFNSANVFGVDFSAWDIFNIRNMSKMFYNVKGFDSNLSNWKVDSLVDASNMFYLADNFDLMNLANWNISNLMYADNLFSSNGNLIQMSNYYDAILGNWTNLNLKFYAKFRLEDEIYYCNSEYPRKLIKYYFGWDINDSGLLSDCPTEIQEDNSYPEDYFVSVWDTRNTSTYSSGSNQIYLPLNPNYGSYSFTVDWGDGLIDYITNRNQPEKIHTYEIPGEYEIKINGTFNGFYFLKYHGYEDEKYSSDNLKLKEIKQWGNIKLGSSGYSFYGTENLKITALDLLDVSDVDYMPSTFESSGVSIVPRINEWNVSNVVSMNDMFNNAINFNSYIGDWDVGNVTSMSNMFSGASSFNQPLNNWNVGKVTNMYQMFSGASSFNQPLNNWNVSNVLSMVYMFYNAPLFNQPLNSWEVHNVTSMLFMFAYASSFNQPLNNWDVRNVTNMNYMFYNANSFYRDISSWCVSNISSEPSGFISAYFPVSYKPRFGCS
ncbi:MAG: BspA family leucine-rich repeat surface protein [Candidatus Nanoarchaeia archaeon]|nr:BspA family leucine-rich repeat surface protein [Candidatus Nanoarchaeia archaeon]